MKHGFYTDSLAYIADEFEKQAEDIIQQLQQLSPSSDDFVCNFRFVFLQKSNIYIYTYRECASPFSHGTVLNMLKQSGINILRGKKDTTTYSDKPVLFIALLFRGLNQVRKM